MSAKRMGSRAAAIAATLAAAVVLVVSGCGGGGDSSASTGPGPATGAGGGGGGTTTGGGGGTDDWVLPTAAEMKATCEAQVGKVYEGAKVTSAKRYEAMPEHNSPPFCQILATRAPYLDLEVSVPDTWTGRIWQQGGGGLDGSIVNPLMVMKAGGAGINDIKLALTKHGAIYATSNGGSRNNVPGQAAPQVWFDGTEAGKQAARDYSYAAADTVLFFTKAITQEFFKRGAKYTYFNGCSNGGRNAYIALERWPDEYSGVVSGCEGMDMSAQVMAWMDIGRLAATPAMPNAAQRAAAISAQMTACDSLDGIADGMIANYAGCKFDIASQACGAPGASTDPAICLNPDQVNALQRIAGLTKTSSGTTIFSGYGPVSWAASGGIFGSAYIALATGDASWLTPAKIATFDPEIHYGPVVTGLKDWGLDHSKHAIASYIKSGKKVIHWHDGNDSLLSLPDHARNLDTMHSILKNLGMANPADGSRFFVVVGTGHAGGQWLYRTDWVQAITDWVEKGIAPEKLTWKLETTGKAIPVCQYPQYPKYIGGDANVAASYACTAPL